MWPFTHTALDASSLRIDVITFSTTHFVRSFNSVACKPPRVFHFAFHFHVYALNYVKVFFFAALLFLFVLSEQPFGIHFPFSSVIFLAVCLPLYHSSYPSPSPSIAAHIVSFSGTRVSDPHVHLIWLAIISLHLHLIIELRLEFVLYATHINNINKTAMAATTQAHNK